MQVGDYVRVNIPTNSAYHGMEGTIVKIYVPQRIAHVECDTPRRDIYAFYMTNLKPCEPRRSSSIGEFFKKLEALYVVPSR